MKKIKQILSALLVAVMLIGIAPVGELAGLDLDRLGFSTKSSALEASGQCGDNVYWTFDKSTGLLTVSGEGEMWEWCFSGNSETETVVVEDGVTSIGYEAFIGCTGLTSITIGNSVTSIGGYAFYGCIGLTSITIPDSVTSIGEDAFSDCTGLTSITIPDSVTSIGEDAFYHTGYYNNTNNWDNNVLYIGNHLIEVNSEIIGSYTIKNGTRTIADYAFSYCTGLTSITIPDSVTSIGWAAFSGYTGLTSITVDSNNKKYDSRNNCNAIIETESNTLIYGCKNTVIPDSVTNIGDFAFSNCTGLTSITIPDSVASIGNFTFSYCTGLSSITIPDSVTSIDRGAFIGCTGLTSITIPDSVTSIGGYAFRGCTGLTSITIPDSVTSIGGYAFSNCTGLTSITIPDSVTSIGYEAFCGCNSLADVYYSGSESEWNEIFIDDNNGCLTNATIHYNYSGSHTHTLKHITVPSTCKVAGMEYDICSECGETFNETTLPLAAHTWGEWTVVKEATTTAEGQEKRTCSVCGKVETRAIEKLKVIKDEKTGIEINYNDEYDSDTEIKVEEQFSGKSFQLINSAYGEVNSKIYDIATYRDGVKVQPNGEITVKVPLPDGFTTNKVFVCYVDSVSGKVTKIPCEVKDGYVIFKTNHFSEYAIVEQSANVKSVSIDDISLNYKKSTTLKPTIKADEGAKYTVKYSTSNAKVATVDKNGKVTATKRGSGSATITCTVTDSNGNTVTDTCKVSVKLSFGQILITYILFGWIWY